MVKNRPTDSQERLEKFLHAVEEAQRFQDDLLKYGLDAVHLYVEDIDGDWLEKWGEDEEESSNFTSTATLVSSSVVNLTMFLKSDDSVAVRVRKQLGEDSLLDVATELEKCLSIAEEDDQLLGVKKVLVGGATGGGTTRESSDGDDEIELLDLAEDLLEKLEGILSNSEG